MKIDLTKPERLAVAWLLARWGLDGDCEANCPFVYHYGASALKKLGGEPETLEGEPSYEKFYQDYEQCDGCNAYFKKEELKDVGENCSVCKECNEFSEC
jgi:hypothetical protein